MITEVMQNNQDGEQTSPTHRRGDFATVTPGTKQVSQGTIKIRAATANPFDGHKRATQIDICEALANNCKQVPLYMRGFVSPPLTATAQRQVEHEQHIQVAIGDRAGISDNCQRFPGLRPHPPQSRGKGHGTRQPQATHCSEHDAHDKIANTSWPALPLSLTTNLPSTDVDHNNKALPVQAGTQHAEYDNERAAALLCGALYWDGKCLSLATLLSWWGHPQHVLHVCQPANVTQCRTTPNMILSTALRGMTTRALMAMPYMMSLAITRPFATKSLPQDNRPTGGSRQRYQDT